MLTDIRKNDVEKAKQPFNNKHAYNMNEWYKVNSACPIYTIVSDKRHSIFPFPFRDFKHTYVCSPEDGCLSPESAYSW